MVVVNTHTVNFNNKRMGPILFYMLIKNILLNKVDRIGGCTKIQISLFFFFNAFIERRSNIKLYFNTNVFQTETIYV